MKISVIVLLIAGGALAAPGDYGELFEEIAQANIANFAGPTSLEYSGRRIIRATSQTPKPSEQYLPSNMHVTYKSAGEKYQLLAKSSSPTFDRLACVAFDGKLWQGSVGATPLPETEVRAFLVERHKRFSELRSFRIAAEGTATISDAMMESIRRHGPEQDQVKRFTSMAWGEEGRLKIRQHLLNASGDVAKIHLYFLNNQHLVWQQNSTLASIRPVKGKNARAIGPPGIAFQEYLFLWRKTESRGVPLLSPEHLSSPPLWEAVLANLQECQRQEDGTLRARIASDSGYAILVLAPIESERSVYFPSKIEFHGADDVLVRRVQILETAPHPWLGHRPRTIKSESFLHAAGSGREIPMVTVESLVTEVIINPRLEENMEFDPATVDYIWDGAQQKQIKATSP